jgi:nucleotide-binding universal stress UspA family protein
MTAHVAARLGLGGRFTSRSFELRDVVASLNALQPQHCELRFVQSADAAATLQLRCEFEGEAAESRAQRLKENLLRGEIAGRYETLLVAGSAGTPGGVTLALGAPDNATLPGGQWFALPASLRAAAVDVLQHAQANGIDVGYRVDMVARGADPTLARQLIPALAVVAIRSRQPEVEASLKDAIALANADGWAASESFIVADDHAADWIARLVRRRLNADADFLPTDYWGLVDAADTLGDSVADETPAAAILRVRGSDFIDELFETIAPSLNQKVLAQPARSPMPAATAGDYVFVSYAHADRDYGNQIISRLQNAGVRVWFDAGIEPGTVWDETLESRLRDAGAVIVCLTAAYEASRYCTREIKFADLLTKPILPIARQAWVWGSGLQLMFQELQVAAYDHGPGFAALQDALRRTAPQVFATAA